MEPYGKRSGSKHVPSAMLDTARSDGCATEISCVCVRVCVRACGCVTGGLLHSSFAQSDSVFSEVLHGALIEQCDV